MDSLLISTGLSMRLKLLMLLLLSALLWAWFAWQHNAASGQSSGCGQPLSYRLDSIDPAFSLTRAKAQQALDQAAMQWNQAIGQQLLIHDPVHGFPVRFVYDERQQQLLQQALLQRNVSRYDQHIQSLQQDFSARLAELQQRQQQFAAQDLQLANDIRQFNQQAREASQASRAALGREQALLLSRQKEHALVAEQLEAEQQKLQDQQALLNATIAERNALLPGKAPAALAEVGLLEQQGEQRRISIFAYQDPQALQLTLLHEFGHALGLGHLPAPDAVMHAWLGEQQQLTADDIAALQQRCKPATQ